MCLSGNDFFLVRKPIVVTVSIPPSRVLLSAYSTVVISAVQQWAGLLLFIIAISIIVTSALKDCVSQYIVTKTWQSSYLLIIIINHIQYLPYF